MNDRSAITGLVLPVLWWLFASAVLLAVSKDGTLDDWVQQRANTDAEAQLENDIVVVLIDDATVAAAAGFGGRAGLACLVREIAAKRPAVIALDYLFDAASETDTDLPPACGTSNERLEAGDVPLVVASAIDWSSGVLREVAPPSAFVPDHALHGYADINYSRRDGVVRSVQLFEHADGAELVASFALTAWAAAQASAIAPDARPDELTIRRALQACTLAKPAPAWIDCRGIAGPARRIVRFFPPTAVLDIVTARDLFPEGCGSLAGPPCIPAGLFARKIVFIGDSRGAPDDLFKTPLFSDLTGSRYFLDIDADVPRLPGVVVHALVAQNMLSDAFTRELTLPGTIALGTAALVLGGAVFLIFGKSARRWARGSSLTATGIQLVALLSLIILGAALLFELAVHALQQWKIGIHPLQLTAWVAFIALLFGWAYAYRQSRGVGIHTDVLGAIAGAWASDAPATYAELMQPGWSRPRRWYALTVSLPAEPLADRELQSVAWLRRRMIDRLKVPSHQPGRHFIPLLTQLDDGAFSLLVVINDDSKVVHDAVVDAMQILADMLPTWLAPAKGHGFPHGASTSLWAGISVLRIVPARAAAGGYPLIVSPSPGDTGTYRLRIKP